MPDIVMCTDKECHMSEYCWRFTAPPSEYRQAYMKFERLEADGSCSEFWANKLYQKEFK